MFDTPIHILAQYIGFVGMFFLVFSAQRKTRKNILIFIAIACLLFTVHFSLLGAFTGAAMNVLLAFQAFLFSKYESKDRPIWPLILVILLFILTTVFTWQGMQSILPGIGAILIAVGNWQRNPQHIRLYGLSVRPFWFVYNVISGSVAGIISETLITTSLLVGLWRYRKRSFQKTS